MRDKILYAILFAWVKIHAVLPMRILYVLSDILYVLVYHVVHYRRKVVRRNLKNSFPDKNQAELRQLERRFYRHFADYVIETNKLAHIPEQELLRRAHVNNPELILDLMDKGHTCFILMMGHYGNWEWFSGTAPYFNGRAAIYEIYRPLTNKVFDRLFLYLRTQFHATGIKKNDTIRDIIQLKRDQIPALVIFIADQTPSKANLHYWTTFLNQESAILTGPEKIAKKLDIPVVFIDTKKVKRGYYTVDFTLITDQPKETPEYWITERYARLMETCILRDPAYWLWTHKRWKHKRQTHE